MKLQPPVDKTPKGLDYNRVLNREFKLVMSQLSPKLSGNRTKVRLVLWGTSLATGVFLLCSILLNARLAYAGELLTAEEELRSKRLAAQRAPDDAKAIYAYAEILRKTGDKKEAARQYLRATSIEPAFYIAYHQLCSTNPDSRQLDEAVERLNQLKIQRPRELMLRVALSELLETQGNYYLAARVLVDLVFQNAVPDKYTNKVNARIHFLLSKAKDAQISDKSRVGEDQSEEWSAPALPEATLKRNLSASKIKEPKVMRGFGHAPLLP